MEFSSLDLQSFTPRLFRRCYQCDIPNPSCPVCASDETCSLQVYTCYSCASTSCVKIQAVNPSAPSTNSGPSAAGPIAGGVVGGIAVIAIATYLVWRFCIKKRRQEFDDEWPEENGGIEKGTDQFSLQRDARASTHTVGSIASTTYTRASNIIQIAYIPGVTNRSVEASPDLVPPVPPIPAVSSNVSAASTPHIGGPDQYMFMPDDLRHSTYSEQDRTSRMVRSSVATTIYRNNAVVDPIPAQAATRGKAVSVSVKNSGKNSPNDNSRSSTPPMPTSNRLGQGPAALDTSSSIVGRIGVPKAVTVTRNASNAMREPIYELSGSERSESPLIGIPERRIANASPQYSNDSSTFDDASSDDDDSGHRADKALMAHKRQSEVTTIQDDSPISPAVQPQYVKPTSSPRVILNGAKDGKKHKHKKSTSLNQIIEEATRKATRDPRHGGLGSYGQSGAEAGPFSDVNIAATP